MTTVHQVFTVRSFRTSKDRDFVKALQIYDAHTHPQVKTDAREIAYWVDRGTHPDGKFYVCGLFISGVLIGFTQFIYLSKERLINFDYFIIEPEKRSAGAFYTFAEEMRSFFAEEALQWDFITAEVAEIDRVNGISRHAQRLTRLFRQLGFCEALVDYRQPLLGLDQADTSIRSVLLILPRVEMESISRQRFLEIINAIYRKHYVQWYSIYPETDAAYRSRITTLSKEIESSVADQDEIKLRGPEREFADPISLKGPPFRGALLYIAKICVSAFAAAAFHVLLRHYPEFGMAWLIGIPASIFVLLVITVSLTDKKQLEAFKMLVSLVSKFFDR